MPYIQRFSVVIAVGRSTLLNGASVMCIRDDTCRLPALCSGGRRRDESVANTHAPCSALIDDACRLVTAAVNHVICKRGESPSNTRDPATINSVIVKTTARHGGLGEGCSAEDIELAHISLVTVASVNIISATQPHIWCVIQSGAGVQMMPREFLVKTSDRTTQDDVMASCDYHHRHHHHHHHHHQQQQGQDSSMTPVNSICAPEELTLTYGTWLHSIVNLPSLIYSSHNHN